MKTLKRTTLVLFALLSFIPLALITVYCMFVYMLGFDYPEKLLDDSLGFAESVRNKLL